MAKWTKGIAFGADQPSAFRLLRLRFPLIFLSCKANARVNDANSGHGPHSPPPDAAGSPKRVEKVAFPQFATEPVLAQKPERQTSKVYPSHNFSSATYALAFSKLSQGPQSDFKIVSLSMSHC